MLDSAKRSFLWIFPYKTIEVVHGQVVVSKEPTIEVSWDALREALSDSSGAISGNWSGYFSYELGFLSEKNLKHYYKPSSRRDAYFQQCALQFVYEHDSATCRVTFDLIALDLLALEDKQFLKSL